MKTPGLPVLIGGGVVLAALALFWLTRKGMASNVGDALGGAAVDLVTGTIGGVAHGVLDVGNAGVAAANDPSINPLQPVGSWLGTTIYDYTHSQAQRGWW